MNICLQLCDDNPPTCSFHWLIKSTECSENLIGVEFDYLFICSHPEIVNLRVRYIPNYYLRNSNAEKMAGMLSLCHIKLLTNLSLFLKGLKIVFINVISVPYVFISIFNLFHKECIEYNYVYLYLCMYIWLFMLHLVPELN